MRSSRLALIPLIFPILLGAFYLRDASVPAHDSFYLFNAVHFFYTYFLKLGHFPGWIETGFYGVHSDFFELAQLGPSVLAIGLIFKVLGITHTLLLYKWALIFDQILLCSGSYWLVKKWTQSRAISAMSAIAFAISTPWLHGAVFNLKFIYVLPWLILFTEKLVETGRLSFGVLVLYLMFLFTYGNTPYFLPPIAFLIALYALCLYFFNPEKRLLPKIDWPTFPMLFATFAFGFLMWTMLRHLFVEEMLNPSGRNPKSAVTDLIIFLTYGSRIADHKWDEWISGLIPHADVTLYCTWTFLAFAFYAMIHSNHSSKKPLVTTLFFVTLFSYGGTAADLAYHLLPGIKLYRHLGHLAAIQKPLIIFLGCLGLEQFFKNYPEKSPPILTSKQLLFLSFGIVLIWEFSVSHLLHYRLSETGCTEAILRKCGNLDFQLSSLLFLIRGIALVFVLSPLWKATTQKKLFTFFAIDVFTFALTVALTSPHSVLSSAELDALFHTREVKMPEKRLLGKPENPISHSAYRLIRENPNHGGFYTAEHFFLGYSPCWPSKARVDFLTHGMFDLLNERSVSPNLYWGEPPQDDFLLSALGCTQNIVRTAIPDPNIKAELRDPKLSASLIEIKKGDFTLWATATAQNEIESVSQIGPEKIDISVKGTTRSGSRYLTLSQAYTTDWRATIDGQATEILRVNRAFMGVLIPPTATQVSFYMNTENGTRTLSATLSMIAVFSWFLSIMFLIRRTYREIF